MTVKTPARELTSLRSKEQVSILCQHANTFHLAYSKCGTNTSFIHPNGSILPAKLHAPTQALKIEINNGESSLGDLCTAIGEELT